MARIGISRVDVELDGTGPYLAHLERIRRADFTDVVLEGMNTIQRIQRRLAPVGKSGAGPHGRIPRSVKAARIRRSPEGGSTTATSSVNYGPAVYTNEGTGLYGYKKHKYLIQQVRVDRRTGQTYVHQFWHPGIRGTRWWDRGFELGSSVAKNLFRRKVGRIMSRGR